MAELLIEAAKRGDQRLLRERLASGDEVNGLDGLGETALNHAIALGHLGLVKDLLAAGSGRDITGRNYQAPPLILAAQRGQRAIVALLAVLADVNARELVQGATALMVAAGRPINTPKAHQQQLAIIQTLLTNGADPALVDNAGRNAIQWAESAGNNLLAQFLSHTSQTNPTTNLEISNEPHTH